MALYTYIGLYLLLFIFVYFFNRKLFDRTKTNDILLSLYHTTIVLCLVLLTGFNTLMGNLVVFIVAILLAIGLTAYLFTKNDEFGPIFEEATEVIKNAFVFFNITVLPFLVSFTMFRYFIVPIQILLALAVTAAVVFLSLVIQKQTSKLLAKPFFQIGVDTMKVVYMVTGAIAIFTVLVFFVTYPDKKINKALNLENHLPTYGFFHDINPYPNTGYEGRLLYITESDYDLDSILQVSGSMEYHASGSDIVYTLYNHGEYIIINDNGEEYLLNISSSLNHIKEKDYDDLYFNYRLDGDQLEYQLILEEGPNLYYIEDYEVVLSNQVIDFPLYAYFSSYQIFIIVIFMFIPITDIKKFTKVIGFKEMTNAPK